MNKEKNMHKVGRNEGVMLTRIRQKHKIMIPLVLLIFTVILNVIGWRSEAFCNFYVRHIFPIWVQTYGRITGMFSFSVGELLLYLAFLIIVVFVMLSIIRLICLIRDRFRNQGKKNQTGNWLSSVYKVYALSVLWIFSIVSVVMTLNCFLLYHVSPVNERFEIGGSPDKRYGFEEIAILRDYVVDRANELAPLLPREANGYLMYEGDMKAEAKSQMKRLSKSFDCLSGYYPNPKGFFATEFFSQQYIMGYYFPFSMEANYNTQMYLVNVPVTMCHELSHLKGFILEDEANFIAYLGCVDAEDILFQYSAYLSVINYLDRDFFEAAGKDMSIYMSHPMISIQVLEDKKFLTPEEWIEVEKKAVIDTEVVKEVSDKIVNTNLTLNGVADGKVSYSRVVNLLLQYYDGKLY